MPNRFVRPVPVSCPNEAKLAIIRRKHFLMTGYIGADIYKSLDLLFWKIFCHFLDGDSTSNSANIRCPAFPSCSAWRLVFWLSIRQFSGTTTELWTEPKSPLWRDFHFWFLLLVASFDPLLFKFSLSSSSLEETASVVAFLMAPSLRRQLDVSFL